jgi:Holliday junction resolvase RusA-like endonuclease
LIQSPLSKLELVFDARPTPHQSVKFTRNGHSYKPKKIVDYQLHIISLVRDQLPVGFEIIPAGSLIFIDKLHYQYAYPKAFSKKKRQQDKIYKQTKPDLQDNLNKAFLDALEGVVYKQDQNIVCINNLEKYYGETDKIILTLRY